ncbi:hypothetical protein [Mycolicibacterium aubagnense]|nr:hypothetical protein [Mycolicibacterium aubagnense]
MANTYGISIETRNTAESKEEALALFRERLLAGELIVKVIGGAVGDVAFYDLNGNPRSYQHQ